MALGANPGVARVSTPNPTAVMAVNGSLSVGVGVPGYSLIVAVQLAASNDNLSPQGYLAGVTNHLQLTPLSGGSALLGVVSPGAAFLGFTLLLENMSGTDNIDISDSASSTAINGFLTQNGTGAVIGPNGTAIIVVTATGWKFA